MDELPASETETGEKITGYGNIKWPRALKLLDNLESRYYDTTADSEADREIENLESILAGKMGFHKSWIDVDSVAPEIEQDIPWHKVVQKARKMSDPNDKSYGQFQATRRKSNIQMQLNTFKARVDFGKPIGSEENGSSLSALQSSVVKFEDIKSGKNATKETQTQPPQAPSKRKTGLGFNELFKTPHRGDGSIGDLVYGAELRKK